MCLIKVLFKDRESSNENWRSGIVHQFFAAPPESTYEVGALIESDYGTFHLIDIRDIRNESRKKQKESY